MSPEMASYEELARVLEALPLLVREARRRRGDSLREAARLTGLSFSTIKRFEAGEDIMLSHARALLQYVDGS